jgi:hypothetical protein
MHDARNFHFMEEKAMNREEWEESGVQRFRNQTGPSLLTMEALRTASSPPSSSKGGSSRIPLYWRVFGGTILSLVGMVMFTVFQQLYSTLSDFRSELNRLQAAREDLMKKEDYNSQMTIVWSNLRDAQAANSSLAAMREQIVLLDQRLKAEDTDQRELTRGIQRLREQVAVASAANAASRPPGERLALYP